MTVSHANPVTQAGFTTIPNTVMLRKDLTPTAKLIYGYLKHLAWRNSSDAVDPPREVIAADLGLGEKAVTEAVRSLQRAPAAEGNDDPQATRLVQAVRRGQGRTNMYLLHDPEEPVSVLSSKADSTFQEKPDAPHPARAQLLSGVKTEMTIGVTASQSPTDGPPKIVQVNGRNEPLDALCEECGIRVDMPDPLITQAVAALNGRKGAGDGIVHLFWAEAARWADEHDRPDFLASCHEDPATFAAMLTRQIREKADRYRSQMGDAKLTPTALRRWWFNLDNAATVTGDMTPEQMRRAG